MLLFFSFPQLYNFCCWDFVGIFYIGNYRNILDTTKFEARFLSCDTKLWVKFAELSKEPKKRKGFLRVRKDVANIVNTGINLSNVNSKSMRGNLVNRNFNLKIQSKSDNEQISNAQKLSASSSKVQSIEVTPANKKEDISGNRIIDANILSDVFCELLCMSDV